MKKKAGRKKAHPLSRHFQIVHRHLKDHFIPHEGNDHRPHVLKHHVLFGYSTFLVLLKVVVVTASIALPSSSLYSSSLTVKNILDLTNATRKNLNLPLLNLNQKLVQAAQAKAQDMLQKQYFSHNSPSGTTPWHWIRNAGYTYQTAGENLAVHYTSAEDAHEGWLASPTHKANIVSTKFKDIGIGVTTGDFEGYPSTFVVQMFGTPKDEAVTEQAEIAQAPTPAATTTITAKVTQPVIKPAQQPGTVAGTTQTKPAPKPKPEIKDSTIQITPKPQAFTITVTTENASSVHAQLGTNSIPLEQKSPQEWTGEIPYDRKTSSLEGDALTITASNHDQQTVNAAALVSTQARPQDIFGFGQLREQDTISFFGNTFTVQGLEDETRKIYLYTLALLSACLLMAILIKIRIQHPGMIAHTLVVMGLVLTLYFI